MSTANLVNSKVLNNKLVNSRVVNSMLVNSNVVNSKAAISKVVNYEAANSNREIGMRDKLDVTNTLTIITTEARNADVVEQEFEIKIKAIIGNDHQTQGSRTEKGDELGSI